jgi:hypothetical protein
MIDKARTANRFLILGKKAKMRMKIMRGPPMIDVRRTLSKMSFLKICRKCGL